MSSSKKLLQAAAGNAGGGALYAEDVFSTYLYAGNSSTQTITNNIDLAGEGGMVWVKVRSEVQSHALFDTERGATKSLNTNLTSAEGTISGVSAFNSDGFNLGSTFNSTNQDYASWTFRKAEKFFDVVTYTGTGSAQTIAHNLGSSVGTLIVKRTDSASNWWTWHKDIGTNYLSLNTTGSQAGGIVWNYTAPTDSVFTVGDDANTNGATYVAYLFASDAGGFGDDETESIIKCGSYTGNGGTQSIDVGFEPQFLLVKNASAGSTNWRMVDTMRGWSAFNGTNSTFNQVAANLSAAEADTGQLALNSTGFQTFSGNGEVNGTGNTIIYIAIRRPMKTPESGTEVFAIDQVSAVVRDVGLVPDMTFFTLTSSSTGWLTSRLAGDKLLRTTGDNIEANGPVGWDDPTNYWSQGLDAANLNYFFKRATGFFDVVAYTGNGGSSTFAHNLGVVPEMMWGKCRDVGYPWITYQVDVGATYNIPFTSQAAGVLNKWNNTAPTDAVFSVNGAELNQNTKTYVVYLFATLAGVSKVGSYTGTAATLNVDCGFTTGARFILIKRTDASGDWYVYDSVRGISAGNDPYFLFNSTAAEVTNTDYIDPLSSGFTVTSTAPAALNASGGTYIFLAIA